MELPHEHSAAAAPLVHGQAAVGAQPGGERGERPCTEPGIHAPIRVEPARGCVTTLEAIARCACSFTVSGRRAVRARSLLRRKVSRGEAGCVCLRWYHAYVGWSLCMILPVWLHLHIGCLV